VDLNVYTTHLNQPAEIPQQVAAAGGARPRSAATMTDAPATTLQPGAPPTVGVSRRPVVELSLSGLGTSAPGVSAGENVFEASSPLDVPAFLRRQT
jgi:hypothetical protein